MITSIQLRVSPAIALQHLATIPHQRCQNTIAARWQVDSTGAVKPQSICWLFCWAETGMGSLAAAAQARSVFDLIFNKTYDWFKANIGPEYARRERYKN